MQDYGCCLLGPGSSWCLVLTEYHSYLFLPSSVVVSFIVCVSGHLRVFCFILDLFYIAILKV